MKLMKRIICFLLVFSCCTGIIFNTASAEDSFVRISVIYLGNDAEEKTAKETAYINDNVLYVSTAFLARYTSYNFVDGAFVREQHAVTSKYGRVEIDTDKKVATLYFNPFRVEEIHLKDVFVFEQQVFLPLHQIAALLKASVLYKETGEIMIVNCGVSLADAEYAMSKITGKVSLLTYSVGAMTEDLYGGSNFGFAATSALHYFGSIVFDAKVKNLIPAIGDIDYYSDFLERCVTNNDIYLTTAAADSDTYLKYMNNFADNAESLYSASKKAKKITNCMNVISRISNYVNISSGVHELTDKIEGNNDFVDKASDVLDIVSYYAKFYSMTADHRDMLNNFASTTRSKKARDSSLNLAVQKVANSFGKDAIRNLATKVCQTVFDEAVKKGYKTLLEAFVPGAGIAMAAAKTTAFFFKECLGIDIASNTEYAIMKDFAVRDAIHSVYYDQPDDHFKSARSTEKYRLAAILFLIANIEVYKAANKVSQERGLSDTMYNEQIETLSSILSLFYLAAEGKGFDCFSAVETNVEENLDAIDSSGIIANAERISQEDALSDHDDISLQNELWEQHLRNSIRRTRGSEKDPADAEILYNEYVYSADKGEIYRYKSGDSWENRETIAETVNSLDFYVVNDYIYHWKYNNNHYNAIAANNMEYHAADCYDLVRCRVDGSQEQLIYSGIGIEDTVLDFKPDFHLAEDSIYIVGYTSKHGGNATFLAIDQNSLDIVKEAEFYNQGEPIGDSLDVFCVHQNRCYFAAYQNQIGTVRYIAYDMVEDTYILDEMFTPAETHELYNGDTYHLPSELSQVPFDEDGVRFENNHGAVIYSFAEGKLKKTD